MNYLEIRLYSVDIICPPFVFYISSFPLFSNTILKGGWISDDDWKDNQFLHIDLENVTKVTRIATQGSFDKNWWTKNYTLDYSQDGVTFISHNNGQVLA